ncbi:hypothetical protein IWQ61_007046 [Dispira simplex]|nr:hypothetical protein IWQ61_007046 [Dispira simplex]
MATTAKSSTRRAADSISSDTDVESCRDPKSPRKEDMPPGLVVLAQGGPSTQEAPLSSQGTNGVASALPKSPRSATSTFQRSLFQLTNSHTLLGKLSPTEKQAMLDNLEYEVNDRVQRLRSNSKWLCESLKLRCELDLSVFPKAVRSLKMGEFCLVYKGSVNEYMHQEAARRIQQFALPHTPEILKKRKFTESNTSIPPPILRNPAEVTLQTEIPTPARLGRIASSVQISATTTPSNSQLKRVTSLTKGTPRPVVSVAVFSPKMTKSPFAGQTLRLPFPPSAKKLAKVITRKSQGPRNTTKSTNRKVTRANTRSTRRAVQNKSSSDSLAAEKPNKRVRRGSNAGPDVPPASSEANKENGGTNRATSETADGQIGGTNTLSKRKSLVKGPRARKPVVAKNDGGGEESTRTNNRSKVVPSSQPTTTTRAADRAALALYTRNNDKLGIKTTAVVGTKPTGPTRKTSRKKINAKT